MDRKQCFDSWKEVVVDFFECRISQCKLYKARDYINKKEIEIKKEKNDKKLERLLNMRDKKKEDLKELRKEAPSTEIRSWLEVNAKKSGSIMKATHVLKFSHTSAVAECAFIEDKSSDTILSTSSLKKPITPDLAHSNGALISVSRFLNLKLEDERVIDLVLNNNYQFLKGFYKNEKQLIAWKNGFSSLVKETRKIKTTDKAKQIYFPLDDTKKYTCVEDMPYQLITPLFSSSLSEEIYQYVSTLIYGEEQKIIKEHRKPKDKSASRFYEAPLISVFNSAIHNYGGEYPRNVSMLNANRQGKSYLFSTQPPTWQSQFKPPIYKESLFDNFSSYQANEDIKYLVEFLQRFKYLDLSYKNPKRYAHLERWVESIIDEVLYYANSIQKLPAAWSADENTKLKIEYQYFLDPYRDDEAFQAERGAIGWQAIIYEDFANWLNRKLVEKDKTFTPQAEHTQLWKKLFKDALREDTEAIKAEKQFYQKQEEV